MYLLDCGHIELETDKGSPSQKSPSSRVIPSEHLHPEWKSLLPPLGPRSTWLVLLVVLLRVCPMTVLSDHLKRGSWLIHSQEAVLDHQLHPAPRLSLSHHPVLCRKHSSLLPLVFAHFFIDFFFSQNKYELPKARVLFISCAVFPGSKTGSGTGGHLIIHLWC